MKIGLLAMGGLAALSLASAATAQDADDWEFQQDAAQNITVAAVRYDGGSMIVVQCKAGALTAVIAGLPPTTGDLKLEATRADGRRDRQDWVSAGAPGAIRSETAARDVRFMHGGGAYAVRTASGVTPAMAATFDLPTQSSNLDRVLTACGWALTDDRDLLTRAGDSVSLTDPTAEPPRARRRSSSRDVSGQGRRREPPPPPSSTPAPAPAEQQVSCIVRAAHLAECRSDHPQVEPQTAWLRRLEGRQVYATDVAAEEGRVVYVSAGGFYTVVDLIAVRRSD